MIRYIILLFFVLNVPYTQAKDINVNSGELIKASDFNSLNDPDYDSGWIPANSNSDNNIILDHNLWVIPNRVFMYVSNMDSDDPNRVVRSTLVNSIGNAYASPENTSITLNKILLSFSSGDELMRCDTNVNPCLTQAGIINTSLGTIKSGYIRVVIFK